MEFAVDYIKKNIPFIKAKKTEGTYLLWIDCSDLEVENESINKFFTEKAKLALDPGDWFGKGGKNYMRMNLACPRSTLKKGLEQLREAIRGEMK